MLLFKELDNSFTLVNGDKELLLEIYQSLEFYVDNYRFMPKYKAGLWDGKKRFAKVVQGGDGIVIPQPVTPLYVKRYKDTTEVHWERIYEPPQISKSEIQNFVNELKLPFTPRDYQVKAVEYALNNAKGICVAGTSSGKSLMIYILVSYLIKKMDLKGALIVPNISLIEQMESDFKVYGLDIPYHTIKGGKEKHFNEPLTISTWQSIYRHKELLQDLDFIVLDECHLFTGDETNQIPFASSNAKYKVGFTGTLPESEFQRASLMCAIGLPKTIVTPRELIDMGYATEVQVNVIHLKYDEDYINDIREIDDYNKEISFIENLEERNKFLARFALSVAQKYNNTLLLYNKIKHGERILFEIVRQKVDIDETKELKFVNKYPKRFDDKYIYVVQSGEARDNVIVLDDLNIYFIRGDIDGEKREEIRNLLEEKKNAVLIATFQTLSTGVNIKNLHNIILGVTTKSYIRIMQTIGRGMRKHNIKNFVRIFDIVDDIYNGEKKSYSMKHFEKRINIYFENEYEIKERIFKI